jgi:release factor glutamine methyltransferase
MFAAMPRLKQLLELANDRLSSISASPRLDIEILLCHCLDKTRSFLLAWPDHKLTDEQQQCFVTLIERRRQGEPIAHLTGEREFWSLMLTVTADTLIPRPETEHLVEQALRYIPENASLDIADLGTGSGAIAIAIAHERPRCHLTAIDNNSAALAIAGENAVRHGINNITFIDNIWLNNINDCFDIIVSNPPYIRADDPHLLSDGLSFEPDSALVAGDNGMAAIKTIAEQAKTHLNPNGRLLIEHGHDQQQAVIDHLQQSGYRNITGVKDLSGTDRIVDAQWPSGESI